MDFLKDAETRSEELVRSFCKRITGEFHDYTEQFGSAGNSVAVTGFDAEAEDFEVADALITKSIRGRRIRPLWGRFYVDVLPTPEKLGFEVKFRVVQGLGQTTFDEVYADDLARRHIEDLDSLRSRVGLSPDRIPTHFLKKMRKSVRVTRLFDRENIRFGASQDERTTFAGFNGEAYGVPKIGYCLTFSEIGDAVVQPVWGLAFALFEKIAGRTYTHSSTVFDGKSLALTQAAFDVRLAGLLRHRHLRTLRYMKRNQVTS
jgi:hypothetical protein